MESHPRLEEMQFELISALTYCRSEYQQRMLERVLEKVLSLKRDFRAQPAASDSPSQSQSEKPSEPSTCEAGESAPRKVWAVLYGDYGNRAQNLEGLYSSKEAAERAIGSPNDIEDYAITEYEVHADEVADA